MKATMYAGMILLFIFIESCGKKDVTPPEIYPTDSIGRIDRWILDSMRRFYYWSDEITTSPDYTLTPDPFFKKLLSGKDRFSWISNGQDIKPASNSYFTFGFHYAFVKVAGVDNYIGVITTVNVGGSAWNAGLRRGSYFVKVNNSTVTESNVKEVNELLKKTNTITLTTATYNTNWQTGGDISLNAGFVPEDVVYYTRTFSSSGVTTGYLYYSSFDERYDNSLLQAFAKLKQAKVSELILDIRYNAGGSVASSAKLAALIAGGLTANEIYAVFQGNRYEGRKSRTLQQVLNTSSNSAGQQYAALHSNALSLNRVLILTTGGTISAAELTVNNLKPFIQVSQIGETTAGKNEASFLITDYRIPKQVYWSMEPTIYKLFNKNNEGNYEAGIAPQYIVSELDQLPLSDIGTPDDPMVNKALQLIYGNNLPEKFITLRRQRPIPATPVYRSAQDPSLLRSVIVKPLN